LAGIIVAARLGGTPTASVAPESTPVRRSARRVRVRGSGVMGGRAVKLGRGRRNIAAGRRLDATALAAEQAPDVEFLRNQRATTGRSLRSPRLVAADELIDDKAIADA
jgi:hypothetical protein